MFYHVELITATDPARSIYEYNLTADEVEQRFAVPYRAGGTVTIREHTLAPRSIKRIRIVRTDQTLAEWREDAEALQRIEVALAGGLVTPKIIPKWEIMRAGIDVTYDFLGMVESPTDQPGTSVIPLANTEDKRVQAEPEQPSRVPQFSTGPQATEAMPIRDEVFVSYSHKDKRWREELTTHLTPDIREARIKVWDDRRIRPGEEWRAEIERALARAKVAVLLVTPNFLASDFITKHELPPLLDAARSEGLRILWIAVSASRYKATKLADYESLNDPARPLDSLSKSARNREWVRISQEIAEVANTSQPDDTKAPHEHIDTESELILLTYEFIDALLLGPRLSGKTALAKLWTGPSGSVKMELSYITATSTWEVHEVTLHEFPSTKKYDQLAGVTRTHTTVLKLRVRDYPGEDEFRFQALKHLGMLQHKVVVLLLFQMGFHNEQITGSEVNKRYYSQAFVEEIRANLASMSSTVAKAIVVFPKADLLPPTWNDDVALSNLLHANADALDYIQRIFDGILEYRLTSNLSGKGLVGLLNDIGRATSESWAEKERLEESL